MAGDEPHDNQGQEKRGGVYQRVFLVFSETTEENKHLPPHERLVGAGLNRATADEIRRLHPGSYYQKIIATK